MIKYIILLEIALLVLDLEGALMDGLDIPHSKKSGVILSYIESFIDNV